MLISSQLSLTICNNKLKSKCELLEEDTGILNERQTVHKIWLPSKLIDIIDDISLTVCSEQDETISKNLEQKSLRDYF